MAAKKPTLDHYAHWVNDHLQRSLTEIGQAVTAVASRHSAKGAYQSGATVVVTYQEAHALFEKGVKTALGQLKRAMRIADLNETQLRDKTEQLLRDYAEKAKAATRPSILKQFAGAKLVDERLAAFDEKLNVALEHFDTGFLDPAEPELPPSMSMTIGTVVGSAIQQGTTDSTQNVSTTINVGDVRAAFTQLNDALKSAELPAPVNSEMRADLDTIKAQLAKGTPNSTVLQEAGRSLRTVSEGLAANVLAAPVAVGIAALLKALGLM